MFTMDGAQYKWKRIEKLTREITAASVYDAFATRQTLCHTSGFISF